MARKTRGREAASAPASNDASLARNREAWLEGVHIAPYEYGTYLNHEPVRARKLLLHKNELHEIGTRTHASGYTVIPLHLYLKNGRAKVEIGLARGKRQYDKRQAIAERESKREIAREMRARDRD